MIYPLLRALLLRLDAEEAQRLALQALQLVQATPLGVPLLREVFTPTFDPVDLAGLRFKNRVGLAAGFDADARVWRALPALGFGHVEVGTVTPRPRPGAPHPRLFTLAEDRALLHRADLPSAGFDAVLARLDKARPFGVVLGVSLGSDADTLAASAEHDYTHGVRTFAPLADYLTFNLSLPHTHGLPERLPREPLTRLIRALTDAADAERARHHKPLPLFVKLLPDLDEDALDDALNACLDGGASGVIAANATLTRPAALRSPHAREAGGLSGAPLTRSSRQLIEYVADHLNARLPLIASGGVMEPHDARALYDAGADLIQVWTGLLYYGPALPRDITRVLPILEPERAPRRLPRIIPLRRS